jgi:hypothetical protein
MAAHTRAAPHGVVVALDRVEIGKAVTAREFSNRRASLTAQRFARNHGQIHR